MGGSEREGFDDGRFMAMVDSGGFDLGKMKFLGF